MHPPYECLQTDDLAVEADLGLVVKLHVTRVERAPQIAQQTEPVGVLESRLDSYTSTPVRSRLAWYIATSARWSSPSASTACSG